MTELEAVVLILAGVAAGLVNALAGGGSAITIPILNELVGISVANGTNRLTILLANLSAVAGFQRDKAVPWRRLAPLVVPAVAGAALGAWLASVTSPDMLRKVFSIVLVLIAVSVVLRPARWVEEREDRLHEPWRTLVFFGIGFYGGFAQAGIGFLLLGALVLGGGMNLVNGNAAKVALIAIYTPIALVFFARAQQVDLAVGATLAVGQMSGAFIGARLAVARGASWIRWVLVVAAVGAAVRLAFS